MTQYNRLNVKLSNSQLNKLKPTIKNERGIVLRLSLNMVGDDETNFFHKLLLTDRQVENLCRLLLTNHQLILIYQKLNYLKSYNQEDFLVDFLVPY